MNVSAGGLNTENQDFVYTFIEAAVQLARRLGYYAVTIPSGKKAPSMGLWEENAQAASKWIRSLAGCAEKEGIWLTIEAPHPSTLAETILDARRFFDVLQDRRVVRKLSWNFFYSG